MGHHADDLSPLSLRSANAIQDALAYSRLIWKCFRGQCLIDYEEITVGRAVLLRESASGHKLGPHGFEVAGQNDLKIGRLKLARVALRLGSAPTHGTKPAGER